MDLKGIFKKIVDYIPRETFSNFQTVVIEKQNKQDRNKNFAGGPQRYKFEFICKQDNEFSFRIGKASKVNQARFEGTPTDTKYISGKNKIKTLIVSGEKFNLRPGDQWLVKVSAQTFSEKSDNILEIYHSEFKG
ncbi:hypothetical protein ACFL27_26695 [candidate division CSSED10-310 bacterium]|uniref:Uncharacterized protein n=1 Tax=candidate division CSSED10-310 bacterium TaxID=2855610 RepID=A0ABV6Z5R2_UNCC1